MDWTTKQFIWLDWVVLAIGIVCIIWVVYNPTQKDKKKKQQTNNKDKK